MTEKKKVETVNVKADIDQEVKERVAREIADHAQGTMFGALGEAKSAFSGVKEALRNSAAATSAEAEEELTLIIEYLRGNKSKEEIWDQCPLYRQKFVELVVEQWRRKER